MMANVVQICMVAKMNSQWLPISTAKFASHLQLLRIKCESIFSSRALNYIFNLVVTRRNFIIAKLSIRKPGSSSVLIKSDLF